MLVYFQVIKYKLCRCMKKKHKGRSNNDRGAVLSLDDVKHHVSGLLLSTLNVSDCTPLTRANSFFFFFVFAGLAWHQGGVGERSKKKKNTRATEMWGKRKGI